MAASVKFLDGRVVGVFMREEECRFYLAVVGVFSFWRENFLV